jgi:hypothetical protein
MMPLRFQHRLPRQAPLLLQPTQLNASSLILRYPEVTDCNTEAHADTAISCWKHLELPCFLRQMIL